MTDKNKSEMMMKTGKIETSAKLRYQVIDTMPAIFLKDMLNKTISSNGNV